MAMKHKTWDLGPGSEFHVKYLGSGGIIVREGGKDFLFGKEVAFSTLSEFLVWLEDCGHTWPENSAG